MRAYISTVCVKVCRSNAIKLENGAVTIDYEKCNYCGRCTKSCPADAYEETRGYLVSFGGTFGNSVHKGQPVIPFIDDHEKLLKVCDAAISFFKEYAEPGERFRFTIDRVGKEKFEQIIKEAYDE